MKRSIRIIGCVLLGAALASPAWAGHGHGKGGPSGPSGPSGATGPDDPGESQAGGLPGLEDRVEGDEVLIATLQVQVSTLMGEVSTLTTEVTDLLGQNNWAVVTAAGAIARASSATVTVADVHFPGSGQYEINFGKDVSKCAYQATIGSTTAVPLPPAPQGVVTVAGDADGDSPNDVFVQTSIVGGGPADFSFHLTVTCP